MDDRENTLKAVRFERPDRIPMIYHINPACWHHYPQGALEDLMATHPLLFPDFDRSAVHKNLSLQRTAHVGEAFTDSWGCEFETTDDGIAGVATVHPLENWDNFDTFTPPDPDKVDHLGPVDWAGQAQKTAQLGYRRRHIVSGDIGHGHTFLKLIEIRGYQNLLYDMADEEPRLLKLIDMLETFNMGLVRKYLEVVKVEWLGYAEDLGMQIGPMLSPEHFRKYIVPSYRRLIQPAKDAGCIIHMHSDGDIRLLVDDLIGGGVDVLNLQDLVNGIDWIRQKLAGKVCIELDIDRQDITYGGSPAQIDNLVREEVEKLGSREGGFMMVHGQYPGVPLENAGALMDAMERYTGFYS